MWLLRGSISHLTPDSFTSLSLLTGGNYSSLGILVILVGEGIPLSSIGLQIYRSCAEVIGTFSAGSRHRKVLEPLAFRVPTPA